MFHDIDTYCINIFKFGPKIWKKNAFSNTHSNPFFLVGNAQAQCWVHQVPGCVLQLGRAGPTHLPGHRDQLHRAPGFGQRSGGGMDPVEQLVQPLWAESGWKLWHGNGEKTPYLAEEFSRRGWVCVCVFYIIFPWDTAIFRQVRWPGNGQQQLEHAWVFEIFKKGTIYIYNLYTI